MIEHILRSIFETIKTHYSSNYSFSDSDCRSLSLMDSKIIKKITLIESEYRHQLDCDLIPYQHISDTITKVTVDVEKIDSITLNCKSEDIVLRCQKLRDLLIDIIVYLKDKLEKFLNIALDVKCIK